MVRKKIYPGNKTQETLAYSAKVVWPQSSMALIVASTLSMVGCGQTDHLQHWNHPLPKLCSFSSPRPIDLNGDGILDVVFGAGEEEFEATKQGIIALNGLDGSLLWSHPARDQIIGSPIFLKINEDSIPDVIIGGRSGQLLALDGRNGDQLWSFYHQTEIDQARKSNKNLLNFYIPQLIPDQNGDGLKDLLVSHGGDATIDRSDPDRPPGKILVVEAKQGKTLVSFTVPDLAETYFSPLCLDLHDGNDLTVIFGTGGETYPGHLYKLPLSDLMQGDTSKLVTLVSSNSRGFIAPPAIVRLTDDKVLDIVVNSVDGRMIALDGLTNDVLWEVHLPGTEVYSSMSVGNFTGDQTPDLFTNFGIGIFPEVTGSIQFMVDGSTGKVAYIDSVGYLQIGSPIAINLDDDPYDEALMTINEVVKEVAQDYFQSIFGSSNGLYAFDFQQGEISTVVGPFKGINAASTPWIGDLDSDGLLDIVYSYMTDTIFYKPFNGMNILRKELQIPVMNTVPWGSYMGTNYNGLF